MNRIRAERGTGTVLALGVVVVLLVLAMAGAVAARYVVAAHRAASAADFAALAGAAALSSATGAGARLGPADAPGAQIADEPSAQATRSACGAAGIQAARNGVRLTRCAVSGDQHDFVVAVQTRIVVNDHPALLPRAVVGRAEAGPADEQPAR